MSSGTIHLRELASQVYPGRVDREKGVVYGLAILGPDSANGRRYLESAMRNAVPLYEGRKSYVDHVRAGQDPSAYDSLGVWHNPRFQDGRIRGDFSVNREHPMAKPFLEACERADLHGQFGFSHDANGKEQPGSKGSIIESIDAVNSVDLVGDPATNKSVWESRDMTQTAVTSTPRNKAKAGSGTWTRKTAAAILTEALRPGAGRKLREAVSKRLLENDGPMYMDDTMEATPGAAGEDLEAAPPAHGAELFQEIVDLIDKCLETADKGSLSPEYLDKLDAIKDIAKSHKSGDDGKPAGGSGDDDGSDESDPDDTSSQESRKKKGKKDMADQELREQVRQLRAENTAIRLANEAGIRLTAIQLKALCSLSEAEIKTAIDEHKTALQEAAKATTTPAGKPPVLPPSPGTNGTHVSPPPAAAPKDAKDFVRTLEQRARQKR